MAVNYVVQAEVVDINSDSPKQEDVFLVDTNVWYWMTYPNATSYVPNQLADYPGYLNNALGAKSTLHHSTLTLSELAHVIERTERQIYEQSVGRINTKEYRHNLAAERTRVVSEIQAAWGQVTNLAGGLAITVDAQTATDALTRMSIEKVDGYDLLILETMKKHGVIQIITDDGDYSNVPGITVFTANPNVIAAAKAQGKLTIR